MTMIEVVCPFCGAQFDGDVEEYVYDTGECPECGEWFKVHE